jgi:hypothetical protein
MQWFGHGGTVRLSWNEVRARAAAFAERWAGETYERGEAQTFYNELFEVFGNKRRGRAAFEARVKLADARNGRIDLFWPGLLLAEHKSAGADMIKAQRQAVEYLPGLKTGELPRHVLVCDFQTFALTDLESNDPEPLRFDLADLPRYVEAFGFIMGVEKRTFRDQDPANILASELMAKVHDGLLEGGYEGSDLERYLVRLLFCLFADDTGIFDRGAFQLLIEGRTREDGSDLGLWLNELWTVLDTPPERRPPSLDEELGGFPYINGELFQQRLPTAYFTSKSRETLLEACGFAWETISPAIFGSLFQGVMDTRARRKKGAHYTSETNILKVVEPLFLDDLRAEFERAKKLPVTRRRAALDALQARMAALSFFDPACGCGNFLVVTYRELRRLETEILVARFKAEELSADQARGFDVGALSKLNVDRFHGIEIEEFPARIAEVALWMTDHIENNRLSLEFGEAYARIPLRTAPHIVHGDALETDWTTVLRPEACSYVLGNPPFIGAKYQSEVQRAQVRRIAGLGGSGGTLDYVAAWFIKAGGYAAQAARAHLAPPPDMTDDEARRWNAAQTGSLLGEELDLGSPSPPPPAGEGDRAAVEGAAATEVPKESPAPRIAFVSTNSITQGEQVAQLWPILFRRCRLEIAFAHRTFAWKSEARGAAHVHVVIIGLARRGQEPETKRLFSYDHINGDPTESGHKALTAYLIGAEGLKDRHLVVREAARPINGAKRLLTGVQPLEGGFLTFDDAEKASFVMAEPMSDRLFRPFPGAEEFINGISRWILHTADASVQDLRAMPMVADRLRKVREFRGRSTRTITLKLADSPSTYGVTVVPTRPFLAMPQVSSERRQYMPIGWLEPPAIPSEKLRALIDADLWEFGILTSAAHMAWMRAITGRLKSDYMYSVGVVYNTFPWPRAEGAKRAAVERLAQAVLDARAAHEGATLADLYDPDLMPPDLRKAHRALDEAVDRLYRPQPFASDRDRAEHLFGLYEKMTAGLFAAQPTKRRRRQ